MSEIKPPKSSQNWQTSIDRRLQERLLRPMLKPGVIDSTGLARKILSRSQQLSNRVPLLDQLEQRWSSLRELSTQEVPVVYAQPRQTEVADRSEGRYSVNTSVNAPLSKPVQTPIVRAKLSPKVNRSDASGMPVAKVSSIPENAATLPDIDRSAGEPSSSLPDMPEANLPDAQTNLLANPIAPGNSVPTSSDRPLVVQAKFTSESTPGDPPLSPRSKGGDSDRGTQKSGSEPTGLSSSSKTRLSIEGETSTPGNDSAPTSLELSRELPTVEPIAPWTNQQQDVTDADLLPIVESQRVQSQPLRQKREPELRNPIVETLPDIPEANLPQAKTNPLANPIAPGKSVPTSSDRPLVVQAKFSSESAVGSPPLPPLQKGGDRGINLDPTVRATQNFAESLEKRSDETEFSLPVVRSLARNSLLGGQEISQTAIAQTPNTKTDLPIVSSRPLPNQQLPNRQQFSQSVASSRSMEMRSKPPVSPVSPKAGTDWTGNIETPLLLSVSPTQPTPRAEINNVPDLTVRSPDPKLGQGKPVVVSRPKQPAVSQKSAIESNAAAAQGDRSDGNTSEKQRIDNIDLEALTSKIERKLMRRLAIEKERRGQGRWR